MDKVGLFFFGTIYTFFVGVISACGNATVILTVVPALNDSQAFLFRRLCLCTHGKQGRCSPGYRGPAWHLV